MRNSRWLWGFLLLVLIPLSVGAGVQNVTFGNAGTANPSPEGPGIRLTVGQPWVGGSGAGGPPNLVAGFWEIHQSNDALSPAGDILPPAANHLYRNYPNPFNPSTRIEFSLAQTALVKIDIYDLKGRKVDSVLHEEKTPGTYSLTSQPRNLASGTYIVLMRAGTYRASQRMMLLK